MFERSVALQEAFNDTWMYEGYEVEVDHMFEKYGGLDERTLRHIVREGKGKERVFAIFALGKFAPSDIHSFLFPYLNDEVREVRWSTAMSLGRLHDKRVFHTLQHLLLEGIEEYKKLSTDDSSETHELYSWYNYHREQIAFLLGRWGNPQAVPALRSTLLTIWKLEQQPGPFDGRWGLLYDEWHSFQDSLAYGLGCLGAWGTLVGIELSPSHLRFAMIYMVLGNLQVSLKGRPYYFSYDDIPRRMAADDLFGNPIVAKRKVRLILAERFGFTEEAQDDFFGHFAQDFAEREKESN